MTIQLPELPYAKSALEPHISARTLEFHHDKHHAAYVTNTNKLIDGSPLADKSLVEIIKAAAADPAKKGLFNNSAQVWNHTFYWNSLAPGAGGEPNGELGRMIAAAFGSFQEFQKQFAACAVGAFGSGWAWLVKKPSGALEIRSTSNAEPAFLSGDVPLITCDVWEHAYYIDYRNDRAAYVKAFWNVANWKFGERNLGG
jgi:Fe-Mn family superoxide dismutase